MSEKNVQVAANRWGEEKFICQRVGAPPKAVQVIRHEIWINVVKKMAVFL
jgi:hypothetical protein